MVSIMKSNKNKINDDVLANHPLYVRTTRGLTYAETTHFVEIVDALKSLNGFDVSDLITIRLYIDAKRIMDSSAEDLTKTGFSIVSNARGEAIKQNPSAQLFVKYASLVKSILSELGLTPTARKRLALEIQNMKHKSIEQRLSLSLAEDL